MSNSKIKKILIVRFGAIGDIVHTSALFRSIKKSSDQVSIHYLTFKTPSMLIENDPDLDKVWVADNKSYKHLFELSKNLNKENFDLTINLQPSTRTRIFSLLVNSRLYIEYKKTFKLHAVENFWKTAKPLFKEMKLDNKLHIYITDDIKQKASKFLSSDKKTVCFNMGTSNVRQGRRWPLSYWQELAKMLIEKYNCDIILTGSEDDEVLASKMLSVNPSIKSFCGKLTLLESAAMLSLCKVVISSDTGPLHIATAVGAKCIGIYGAAPISRTGPYGSEHFALSSIMKCVPCNKRKCRYNKESKETTPCLFDIQPEQMIDLVDKHSLLE